MKAPVYINRKTRVVLRSLFTGWNFPESAYEKSYAEKVEEAKKEIQEMIRKFGGLGHNLNF